MVTQLNFGMCTKNKTSRKANDQINKLTTTTNSKPKTDLPSIETFKFASFQII